MEIGIVSLDLSQDLRREDEEQDDDLQRVGQIDADPPLDDGGQGEQYQRQDAQEHVFKVPVEKLGHHGQDDQDSKNDVDGDHRFFPLQLFPQLTPHPGSFAGIFWPHLYLPFYIIYCYSIAVSGTKVKETGAAPGGCPSLSWSPGTESESQNHEKRVAILLSYGMIEAE